MKYFEPQFDIKNEPELRYVRRFFSMSREVERTLIEKIKESNGLVRVFVHPDFKKYAGFEDMKSPDIERLGKAEQLFETLLKSKSEDLPPLFIFESGADPREFEEEEARLDSITQNDLYVVRTQMANPHPLSPYRESNYRWPVLGSDIDEETEQMWVWLIAELKKLGVKKMLMGGLELYISNKGDAEHSGCLGTAISKLKNSFEIELSSLTWPGSRGEIRTKKN